MNISKSHILLASALILPCGLHAHTFINHTPENVRLHVDRVAGFDDHEGLPKGETINLPTLLPTRGITVKAALANRPEETILKDTSWIIGNCVYHLVCDPKIESKEIPGGHAEIVTAIKFMLFREAPWLLGWLYKSGKIAESEVIETVPHKECC